MFLCFLTGISFSIQSQSALLRFWIEVKHLFAFLGLWRSSPNLCFTVQWGKKAKILGGIF